MQRRGAYPPGPGRRLTVTCSTNEPLPYPAGTLTGLPFTAALFIGIDSNNVYGVILIFAGVEHQVFLLSHPIFL